MNKISLTGGIVMIYLLSLSVSAQSNRCATMQELEKSLAKDPAIKQRMQLNEAVTQSWIKNNSKKARGGQQIITIPVVVHVIWNTIDQNISDAQIYSQMEVLNEDFRLLNANQITDNQNNFYYSQADAEIEFCLAKQDPDGNPTTGITRTQTNRVNWFNIYWDDIKSTTNGGHDNWDATKYLNLYVVNLSGGDIGYATLPGQLGSDPLLDGVIIDYQVFGRIGTAGTGTFAAFGQGRTATHEIGHWLNLRHIWGDNYCGDDFVSDTEPAETENLGCPNWPHHIGNACGSGMYGEMFMNYMDYVNDACMCMFTYGQAIRMHATLNGIRSGLLNSNGCEIPSATAVNDLSLSKTISVFPNPGNGNFSLKIDLKERSVVTAHIVNVLGATVKELGSITKENSSFEINNFPCGSYFLKVNSENESVTKKIVVIK